MDEGGLKMILYLAMKVSKWEDMEFEGLSHVKIQADKDDYGFVPAFRSYERAVEVAGDEKLVKAVKAGE